MHIQHRIFKICNKQFISFAEELQMLLNTPLWKQFSTLLANTLNMDPFVVSQLFPCLLHYSTIIANQRVSRMQHLHVSVKIGLRHERFIADVAYNPLWDWNRRTITDYFDSLYLLTLLLERNTLYFIIITVIIIVMMTPFPAGRHSEK